MVFVSFNDLGFASRNDRRNTIDVFFLAVVFGRGAGCFASVFVFFFFAPPSFFLNEKFLSK